MNQVDKKAIDRRNFLQMGVAGFAMFAGAGQSSFAAAGIDNARSGIMKSLKGIGALLPPDENAMMLPPGFKSRIVARSGQRGVSKSAYVWHDAPDGGACFATDDGGWIYVSNAEIANGRGGVGALRFDAGGEVIDSYSILQGTSVNCAGGKTPWQTWLSCEEIESGQVYECDPFGNKQAIVRPALGTFKHEAVAVDPVNETLYLTEDLPDGGFYRFIPVNGLPDLTSGTLEIARLNRKGNRQFLSWQAVPDPLAVKSPTRKQIPDYLPFSGGEGLVYQGGLVYFSTKGDNRIWCYNVKSNELSVVYDIATSKNPILSGVDNLNITPSGDVLVAEDKGNMQIVLLTPDDRVIPLLQIVGHDRSEIVGPAFDPSYSRLYFSSQRGAEGVNTTGITYEITAV